jgi:hypothetical protein
LSIYATGPTWLMATGRETTEGHCEGAYHIDPWSKGQIANDDGTYSDTIWDEYAEVYIQFVPPHIGHPKYYPNGDDCAEFLPPLPPDIDPDDWTVQRAAVFVGPNTEKGTERHGQEYRNPLLVLSGAEYNAITFKELWARLERAFETHWTTNRPQPPQKEYRFKHLSLD